jgi:hypothetical protein
LYVSETYRGSVHDKKIADEQDFRFDSMTTMLADLGFIGYGGKNVTLKMPFKKPKGKELTEEQKEQNKALSSVRVSIEHDFAHCKTWRVVKEIYRSNSYFKRHRVFLLACKLHNFRTHFRENANSS